MGNIRENFSIQLPEEPSTDIDTVVNEAVDLGLPGEKRWWVNLISFKELRELETRINRIRRESNKPGRVLLYPSEVGNVTIICATVKTD